MKAPASGGWLPYGRQDIGEDEIAAVVDVLRSDWLTTGPAVPAFEKAVAERVLAAEAVALSSGTAALHAAYAALGIGPGDEVIVPAITFAATSNAAVYLGARPVFADVDPETLLLDPADAERRITTRTRAIVCVDYAGQPCDYDGLRSLARSRGLFLVSDAAHAFGATYQGQPVGSLVDLTVFSFHPVKTITTGEGGMVTTNDPEWAQRIRTFRNHGITTDHRERAERGTASYEMTTLGYNYRLTDLQAALGRTQLARVDRFLAIRRDLAATYDRELARVDFARPLRTLPGRGHAHHLAVVLLDFGRLGSTRDERIGYLRRSGIGANVHYRPPYLHPYYRQHLGTGPGLCPVAESAADRILTLPLHTRMTGEDVRRVISALATRA